MKQERYVAAELGRELLEVAAVSGLSSAELRNTKKEIGSIDRKMEKLSARIDALHVAMAEHDPADIPGLTAMTQEVAKLEKQVSDHEHRWLELTELVGG